MLRRSLPLVALASAVLLLWGLASPASAQNRSNMLPRTSPNASVSQTIGVTEVTITYGRPSVRGRTIFGDLVPYDAVWRTGANEATTISFSTPVEIEGQALDAGTYGLFTVPGEDQWTVIFNETADQWGAYNYDDSKDVLRVDVDARTGSSAELLTFNFRSVSDTSATLVLHWSDVVVPVDVSVDTKAQILKAANEKIGGSSDWQTPARYASYALQEGVDTDRALSWVDTSIEREETFANLNLKARLQAVAEDYASAVATGEKAIAKAESMDDAPNGVEELKTAIEEWKSQM